LQVECLGCSSSFGIDAYITHEATCGNLTCKNPLCDRNCVNRMDYCQDKCLLFARVKENMDDPDKVYRLFE